MAPVEVEIFRTNEITTEEIVDTDEIGPGASKKYSQLDPAYPRSFCNQEDDKGSLLLSGDLSNVQGVIYSDEDDEIGEPLDLSEPIEFSGPEEVVINKIDSSNGLGMSFVHVKEGQSPPKRHERKQAKKQLPLAI